MKHKLNRRDFLMLSGTLVGGAIVAGCAPAATKVPQATEAPTEAPTKASAGEKVNLTVFVNEEQEGGYQSDQYMKRNPNVDIKLIIAAGESSKLDSMMAAGTPPDISIADDGSFAHLYSLGALLNLQPRIDADSAFSLKDFFPDILAGAQAPNGDQYGLGGDFGAQLLWYNKTLMDAGSVAYPDENWTWDDHMAAAAALTKGEGAQKVYGSLPFNWFAPQFACIWQNDGKIFSDDTKTCLMDTPAAIGALDYMYSYVHNGTAPSPGELAGMGMEMGQLFAANRAALFPGGHWEKAAFEDTKDFEWDVTVLPKGKVASTYLHQAYFCGMAATKVADTVWDWLKFISDRDMSIYQCTEYGGLSWRTAVADELINKPPEAAGLYTPRVWKALQKAGRGGKNYSKVLPFGEIMDSVWAPALDKMFNGEATPEKVGQEIKAGADPILSA
jgi:multiple sugar transport system substrate-binding protein